MTKKTDANRRLPMIWQKTNDSERPALPPYFDYLMTVQVKYGVNKLKDTPLVY